MKKTPFFSVIIPNKNSLKWLNKCLSSLKNQTFKNFEMIFIDNASTDQSVEFVKSKFPFVKVSVNTSDVGPGISMNIGARIASGKYLFLMNADSYIEADALEKLAYVLKRHPDYQLMELNMKHYDKTNINDKPYKFGMDIFGYPMPSDKLFYADACGLVITKSLFNKLGGFDETFYMYLDDVDFSWRARLVGTDIYLLENIYIYHHTGSTSIPTSSYYHKKYTYTTTLNRRYHAQKNNLRALIKNYSLQNLLWALPASTIFASVEGFLYLFKGNLKGFIVMHQAILWNCLNMRDTLHERTKIQSQRKVSDKVILDFCEKKVAKIHSFLSHGIPLLK